MYIVYGNQQTGDEHPVAKIFNLKQVKYKYRNIPNNISLEDFKIVMKAFDVDSSNLTFPQFIEIKEDTWEAHYVGGMQDLLKKLNQ